MRGNKGKNAIPVNQYNKDWEFMKRYPSIKDAAAETGIKASSICAACKGKYHSAGGYHWVYYHEVNTWKKRLFGRKRDFKTGLSVFRVVSG